MNWGRRFRADRAAQIVFSTVVRFQQLGRFTTMAAAQAAIVQLLVRQLKRLDAGAAGALCQALARECEGVEDAAAFLAARAALTDAERRQP